jgi:hypothetical protein
MNIASTSQAIAAAIVARSIENWLLSGEWRERYPDIEPDSSTSDVQNHINKIVASVLNEARDKARGIQL